MAGMTTSQGREPLVIIASDSFCLAAYIHHFVVLFVFVGIARPLS